MKKLLAGVGINDADYQVKTRTVQCPYYKTWSNMINRVYAPSYKARFKAYQGCSVDERWHSFMAFKEWMQTQDWEGNHLDKDLLIDGNQVYGPNTCLFISRRVNNFLTEDRQTNSKYLKGVYLNSSNRYVAQCGTGSKTYLGSYGTQEEAHAAYMIDKRKAALVLAEKQKDVRVKDALVKRYS